MGADGASFEAKVLPTEANIRALIHPRREKRARADPSVCRRAARSLRRRGVSEFKAAVAAGSRLPECPVPAPRQADGSSRRPRASTGKAALAPNRQLNGPAGSAASDLCAPSSDLRLWAASRHMADGATPFEAWYLPDASARSGARVIARCCRGWSKRGGWAADPQSLPGGRRSGEAHQLFPD